MGKSANGVPIASLDELLALDDVRYETVHVPEWGRSVRLVSLSGEDRNRIAVAVREHAKRMGSEEDAEVYLQARIILASMVDESGAHIGDQAQASALAGKNGAALTRLYLACNRLSGLGEEAIGEEAAALKATPSSGIGGD